MREKIFRQESNKVQKWTRGYETWFLFFFFFFFMTYNGNKQVVSHLHNMRTRFGICTILMIMWFCHTFSNIFVEIFLIFLLRSFKCVLFIIHLFCFCIRMAIRRKVWNWFELACVFAHHHHHRVEVLSNSMVLLNPFILYAWYEMCIQGPSANHGKFYWLKL